MLAFNPRVARNAILTAFDSTKEREWNSVVKLISGMRVDVLDEPSLAAELNKLTEEMDQRQIDFPLAPSIFKHVTSALVSVCAVRGSSLSEETRILADVSETDGELPDSAYAAVEQLKPVEPFILCELRGRELLDWANGRDPFDGSFVLTGILKVCWHNWSL